MTIVFYKWHKEDIPHYVLDRWKKLLFLDCFFKMNRPIHACLEEKIELLYMSIALAHNI